MFFFKSVEKNSILIGISLDWLTSRDFRVPCLFNIKAFYHMEFATLTVESF